MTPFEVITLLQLYLPKPEDLWFREEMMSHPETMSYNHRWGGTISFPKELWQEWYQRWMDQDETYRFYRYLIHEETGCFVGEVAYRYDPSTGHHIANLIIHAKYRRQGFGTEGLALLCHAAKSRGITTLYDDIAADNPSVSLFLKNGFSIASTTESIVLVRKIL